MDECPLTVADLGYGVSVLSVYKDALGRFVWGINITASVLGRDGFQVSAYTHPFRPSLPHPFVRFFLQASFPLEWDYIRLLEQGEDYNAHTEASLSSVPSDDHV